jgi:hypothetical protein
MYSAINRIYTILRAIVTVVVLYFFAMILFSGFFEAYEANKLVNMANSLETPVGWIRSSGVQKKYWHVDCPELETNCHGGYVEFVTSGEVSLLEVEQLLRITRCSNGTWELQQNNEKTPPRYWCQVGDVRITADFADKGDFRKINVVIFKE